ncbi:cuticle protein AMP1A-like [Panulirus ornatus]|uniref:cuticle protein AMP1A-like n=1 Tax=Panulirus ornatus TaxID=150431 RepID=UPI003A894E05
MFANLVFVALVAVVIAAPQRSYTSPPQYGHVIPILKDERQGPDALGNYHFEFETGNGISRNEQGAPKGYKGVVSSEGGWSFTFPNGSPAYVSFVADEDGFQPESDLLPVGPPLPPHAIAQIEFARQQEASGGSRPADRYTYNK